MAYLVSSHFAGLSVLTREAKNRRCPSCLLRLTAAPNEMLAAAKPAHIYDISGTSDGYCLASGKFKQVYDECGLKGLDFHRLGNGFFVIFARRRVKYDLEKFEIFRSDFCDTCSRYAVQLVSPFQIVLNPAEGLIADDELVESELDFGDHKLRQRQLLCGSYVREVILEQKLKGFVFKSIAPISR